MTVVEVVVATIKTLQVSSRTRASRAFSCAGPVGDQVCSPADAPTSGPLHPPPAPALRHGLSPLPAIETKPPACNAAQQYRKD